jgi:hypothetical protein
MAMDPITQTLPLLRRKSSNDTLSDSLPQLRELVFLLALGGVAVLWHAATRGRGLEIPGHQGLVWIALVMVGRTTSRYRWAAVATATGAAATAMLPFWGFGDPFRWLMYLAAGAAVDLFYSAFPNYRATLWLLVIVGGLGHMTKPLLRVPISTLTGIPYGSLLWGVGYPALTHFTFGALGTLAGAGAIIGLGKLAEKRRDH